jgi:TetR/AcrR family transcriptional regulator, mexJK operon transcriptional repressor
MGKTRTGSAVRHAMAPGRALRLAAPLAGIAASTTRSPKVQQILAAARAVFMAEGYGAASMDAIAREANVSKATLYAHFSGKEELFAAVIRERCAQLDWAKAADELQHTPPEEGLSRIARDFCELILSPGVAAMYRLVVAEAPRFPQLGRVFFDTGPAQLRRSLADYLARATRQGALAVAKPHLAAEQFIGMLLGHFQLVTVLGLRGRPSEREIDEVIDLAVTLFLRGYGLS